MRERFYNFVSSIFSKTKLRISYESEKLTFWWVIKKLCIIFENGGFVELLQNFSCKAPYLHLKKIGFKKII